jgi:hypothetical protein
MQAFLKFSYLALVLFSDLMLSNCVLFLVYPNLFGIKALLLLLLLCLLLFYD